MTNHHDTFFKQVFSDKANTIDFSKHALREALAVNLDYESFRLENVSYVDEHLAEYFFRRGVYILESIEAIESYIKTD